LRDDLSRGGRTKEKKTVREGPQSEGEKKSRVRVDIPTSGKISVREMGKNNERRKSIVAKEKMWKKKKEEDGTGGTRSTGTDGRKGIIVKETIANTYGGGIFVCRTKSCRWGDLRGAREAPPNTRGENTIKSQRLEYG